MALYKRVQSLNLRPKMIRQYFARTFKQFASDRKEITDFSKLGVVAPKYASVTMSNGIFVSSLDNGAPLIKMTVAFLAGSRYETTAGVAHALRSAGGMSTGQSSGFLTSRILKQIGAILSVSGDRELVYYTIHTTREGLLEAIECMANLVSNQEFRAWELSDNAMRLRNDIARVSPQVWAMEHAHRAAFKRTLGNSLFMSPSRINSINTKDLKGYAATTLSPARCAVAIVGAGLDKGTLLAGKLKLCAGGEADKSPAIYYGGLSKKDFGGDTTHVVLASRGFAVGTKQSTALCVLAGYLNSGLQSKWGDNKSPINKVVKAECPFASRAFNISYSDMGLFGIAFSAFAKEAGKITLALASFIKKLPLNAEVVERGKNEAKRQLFEEFDRGKNTTEKMAAIGVYCKAIGSIEELGNDIDGINENNLKVVLSNSIGLGFSVGATGNTGWLPLHQDEL